MRPSIDGFWIDGFVCACGALAATTSVSESWGARRGNKKPAKAWLSAGFVFGVVAPRAGLEPATERLTAVCSTTELPGINTLQSDISELGRNAKMKLLALPRFGGHARNRTGVHGFAGRCVTTPPRGRFPEGTPLPTANRAACANGFCSGDSVPVWLGCIMVIVFGWRAPYTNSVPVSQNHE